MLLAVAVAITLKRSSQLLQSKSFLSFTSALAVSLCTENEQCFQSLSDTKSLRYLERKAGDVKEDYEDRS